MLVKSACQLSKSVGAKAIVGMTKSGFTGFSLAKNRPEANIYIFTDDKYLLRTMIWYGGSKACIMMAKSQLTKPLKM